MIGVDWGTSNFRAFRLRDGQVLDRMDHGPALLSVPPGGFAAALRGAVGPWLADGETRVLLGGMVGSRQGWMEAPYLACPADPAMLAGAAVAVPFDGAAVRLVPGLSAQDEAGVPEVMRGEEVQLFGAMGRTGGDAVVCLPGSHSKWVRIAGGRIAGFRTHMTGEAFAALRQHTILGRMMQDGPTAPAAFARGVARAAEHGGLLHHLFGVRTLGLFGALPEPEAASYLSGILIGHEVHASVAMPDVQAAAPGRTVCLIGTPALCTLYAAALAQCGWRAEILDQDAAAAGLVRIGEHVAWT